MANKIQFPDDKDLAAAMIANQAKEPGAVGGIFGTKEHAPTNTVSIAVVLMILLLGAVFFAPLQAGVDRAAVIPALFSAITFSLGLMFGQNHAK